MAALTQTWPGGPAFSHLPYKVQVKIFAVDDTVSPSAPGWITVGDIVGNALPAVTGLLAATGFAGQSQKATNAQLEAAILAWLLTLPNGRPAAPGFYLNGEALAYRKA